MAYVLVMLIWAVGGDTQDYRELPFQRYPTQDACNAAAAVLGDRLNNPNVQLFCIEAIYYPNVK